MSACIQRKHDQRNQNQQKIIVEIAVLQSFPMNWLIITALKERKMSVCNSSGVNRHNERKSQNENEWQLSCETEMTDESCWGWTLDESLFFSPHCFFCSWDTLNFLSQIRITSLIPQRQRDSSTSSLQGRWCIRADEAVLWWITEISCEFIRLKTLNSANVTWFNRKMMEQ